jgi:hypothetical protein
MSTKNLTLRSVVESRRRATRRRRRTHSLTRVFTPLTERWMPGGLVVGIESGLLFITCIALSIMGVRGYPLAFSLAGWALVALRFAGRKPLRASDDFDRWFRVRVGGSNVLFTSSSPGRIENITRSDLFWVAALIERISDADDLPEALVLDTLASLDRLDRVATDQRAAIGVFADTDVLRRQVRDLPEQDVYRTQVLENVAQAERASVQLRITGAQVLSRTLSALSIQRDTIAELDQASQDTRDRLASASRGLEAARAAAALAVPTPVLSQEAVLDASDASEIASTRLDGYRKALES